MYIHIVETIYLGVLSMWDLKEKQVPVFPLLAGGGILLLIAIDTCLRGEVLWGTLLGGLVPGALLVLLALLTGKIGVADGLVMMALGAQCGLRECLQLLLYSLFSLSVFSVFLLVLRKANCSTRIPYLPFLLAGYLFRLGMA